MTTFMDDMAPAANVQEQVQAFCTKMDQLLEALNKAEFTYQAAKKEYDTFTRHVFPDYLHQMGVGMLMTENGHQVKLVTKTICSIAKDGKKRANVAQWLRDRGAEDYIKGELVVTPTHIDELRAAGIDFESRESMNGNSIKAYLLDQLGQRGLPAQIEVQDIPEGISFYQYDVVEVN